LNRIISEIKKAKLVIADFSKPDKFNMPLEAGIALGLSKPCAFLIDNFASRKRVVSDLGGYDFLEYKNNPQTLIEILDRWLRTQLKGKKPGSVPVDSLQNWVYPLNQAFMLENSRHDLEGVRQRLIKTWPRLGLSDIKDFAQADGKAWVADKVAEQGLESMRRFAEGLR
jgi:hypothetical protein